MSVAALIRSGQGAPSSLMELSQPPPWVLILSHLVEQETTGLATMVISRSKFFKHRNRQTTKTLVLADGYHILHSF